MKHLLYLPILCFSMALSQDTYEMQWNCGGEFDNVTCYMGNTPWYTDHLVISGGGAVHAHNGCPTVGIELVDEMGNFNSIYTNQVCGESSLNGSYDFFNQYVTGVRFYITPGQSQGFHGFNKHFIFNEQPNPTLPIVPQVNYITNVPLNYYLTFELETNEITTIVDSIKIGQSYGGVDEMPQFQVIGSDSFILEPNSSHILTIRYIPDYNNSFFDFFGLDALVWAYNQSELNLSPFMFLRIMDNSVLNLSSTPSDPVFTDVPVGTFVEQDITFTNISETIQEISDILPGYYDYEDSLFVELSEFSIINETQFDLNPGESQIITLRYSPEDVGSDDAFLYSFSPDYISHIMPISGSSILPTVTIEPDTLDFGSVQVGAFEEVEIFVYPDFLIGAVAVVDVNTSSPVFTIVSDTAFTILPEEVIPITVRFSPENEDSTYTGNLEIISSVGDTTIILGSSVQTGTGSQEVAGTFDLTSPVGITGVSIHTQYKWEDAFNGATGSYRLRYGKNIADDDADTYVEINNIMDNEYFVETDLALGDTLNWWVWAVNQDGSMQPALQQGSFILQTDIPQLNGPISGSRALLPENSPYLVTGNVDVLETNNLTIPAGIEILFEDDYGFEISGEFQVHGEEGNGVEFKHLNQSSPGMWEGIRFTNTAINLIYNSDSTVSSGSYFYYTTIQDAGSSGNAAIDGYWDGRSVTKSLAIENSTITGNAGPGIRCGHLSRFIDNTISDNGNYGIDGGEFFDGNIISSNGNYGISTQNGTQFIDNTIQSNNGSGIISGAGNLFSNNLIEFNNGDGITTDMGDVFEDNSILNNGGWGIYAGLGETFTNNTISGNGSYGIKTEAGELFENNVVSDNDGFGIETTTAYSSGTITFSNNNVNGNTGGNGDWDGGILTSILAEFTDNVVSGNTGYGITGGHFFSGDSVYNNSSFGIHTDGGDSFINTVVNENGSYGIYTATGSLFSNNDISGNTGYGLHSDAGDTFENNTVNNNGEFGIYSATGNEFTSNDVSGNDGYGIYSGTGDTFTLNIVSSNGDYGIKTDAGDSFSNNEVMGNGGFGIDNVSGNTFTGNTVSENGSWGINTDAGDTFNGNYVENNNGFGINTDTGNTFTDNVVSGNGGYGINTDAGDSFTNNNVENNSSFGIDTDTGEIFTGNVISGNTSYGINTDTGNTFTDNVVSGNGEYGINTDSGHTFSGNTISDNNSYGLNISPGSSAIALSGNTFESNSENGLQASITTVISIDGDTFTANHNNGIVVDGASTVSISTLTQMGDGTMDHGGSTPDGNNENGLRIVNVGSFSLTSSNISDNYASGIYLNNTSEINISLNTFSGNSWSAIRQISGTTSVISDNIFTENQNSSQHSSNTGGAIYTDMPGSSILGNEISGNISSSGGGIFVQSGSPYIYDNLITNNSVYYQGGGIYVGGDSTNDPSIIFNTISSDISQGNQGGGVFILNTGNNRSAINSNIISYHSGHAVYGDPDSLMYNNITDNLSMDSSIGFGLRKTNAEDMNNTAGENWWGTTNMSEIDSLIWDGADDGFLGHVASLVILSWPSPDAPGQVSDAISISLYEDDSYSELLTYLPGIGATLYIELEAVDENPYSVDQTPITVNNINAFSYFDILATETNLSSGLYRGTVQVQEGGSQPFSAIIGASIGDTLQLYSTVDPGVELLVAIAGPADGELLTTELNFELGPTDSTGSEVTLTNVGTGYMNADISSTEIWLSVSTDHIELVPDDSATFEVIVNSSGVANGDHSGLVQIAYGDQIDSINVSMTVQNIIYALNQQIESGTFNAVPLMLDLNDGEEVSGLIFAIEVSPVDAPELVENLQIEVVASTISDPLVNVIEPGLISVVILDIDNPLSGLGVNFANLLITLPPNAMSFEIYNLSISGASASDAEYNVIELASLDTADLEVFITNDPPYFSPPFSDRNMLEGDSLTVEYDIIDPEGTEVSVELIESADYVSLNHTDGDTSGTIAISLAFGDISSFVLLHATDSGNPPVTGADSFMVFINHYPDWDAPPSMQVLAGDNVSILISTSDIDLDNVTLTLDAENSPDYAVWDEGTSTLTLQTTEGALDGTVIFTLTDDGNPVASKDVSIAVDILHLPILSALENQSINEDDTLIVAIYTTDADGDSLFITVVSDNGNVSVSLESSAVIAIPTSNYFGTAQITVSVSDSTYTVEDSFTLTIDPVNDSPVAESGSYELNEDTSAEFTLDASDVDNEDGELSFEILSGPFHGSLDTLESSFSYIPDSNFNGGDSLTFEVSDGELADTSMLSFNVLPINDPPTISGLDEDIHIPENDTLDVQIDFTDPDGDSLTVELEAPAYCSAVEFGAPDGVILSFTPDSDDESAMVIISISDGNTTVSASVNVLIYNTYLVGDVRPSGGEAAGEFGDGFVLAPDIINALKVSTEAPGTEIPDSTSNLFDAFDSSPMEVDSLDVNGDGDFYDEGERGGDGYIEVSDVIVSLNRATLIPGYPNVRRVDNNYPYSSRFYRNSRSQDPTDMIVLGSITAMPGETAQIPVTLIRGESEFSLTSLVIGFAVTYANDVEPSQPLSFTADIDCYPLSVPTNNHFLSLLLMNIDGQNPRSELLLGHISFVIPEDAHDGDMYTFSSQGESGSTINYESILFSAGTNGSVTIEESLVMLNTGLMHSGPNLKSFYVLPEDASLENMFSPLSGQISGIIGEGVAAINNDGNWEGSLQEINAESGYWLSMLEETDFSFYGYIVDSGLEYSLHSGQNLISFPSHGSIGIAEGLPDDVEDQFTGIISEGVAAINNDGNWEGSLTAFEGTKGYWVEVQSALTFSYELTNLSEDAATRLSPDRAPVGYEYKQSTKQAFYFIESVENIEIGDWILSFNDDVVIGARQWQGSIIDVPAMGSDGSDYTKGYIEAGSVPSFKILRGDELINLGGDIPAFENNQLYMVSSLIDAVALPESFSLDRAYPNPFNPTTTLSFAIPVDSEVSLSIYNLQGREVSTLIDGNMEAGYHSVVWNANSYSSGVYFVKMVAGEFVSTQKLMLIK